MVDSSNESLQQAYQELGPNLWIGSLLQTNFQKVDVPSVMLPFHDFFPIHFSVCLGTIFPVC